MLMDSKVNHASEGDKTMTTMTAKEKALFLTILKSGYYGGVKLTESQRHILQACLRGEPLP